MHMSGLPKHVAHGASACREHQSRAISAQIQLIGAACGRGAKDTRCAAGPDSLQHGKLVRTLRSHGIQTSWQSIIHADKKAPSDLHAVTDVAIRLADLVEKEVRLQHFFAVLGGDHSCAIGTWNGVNSALHQSGPVGLIWLDAHMDSHTPETSLSGTLHGMPLACLLGQGAKELTGLAGTKPALSPVHVCLIGVRSFEPEEKTLLDRMNVRVYYMAEVRKHGLGVVMHEAFRHVADGTAGVGVSIDLDGIDPWDAPAVGSPVPEGIRRHELLPVLRWLSGQSGIIGTELAEFNPALDRQGKTAHLIRDILTAITPQRASHESYN